MKGAEQTSPKVTRSKEDEVSSRKLSRRTATVTAPALLEGLGLRVQSFGVEGWGSGLRVHLVHVLEKGLKHATFRTLK